MDEGTFKIDGIAILMDGQRRTAFDIARDFVQEQSMGEWGDDQVEEDARRLARLLLGFAEVNCRLPAALPPTETPDA